MNRISELAEAKEKAEELATSILQAKLRPGEKVKVNISIEVGKVPKAKQEPSESDWEEVLLIPFTEEEREFLRNLRLLGNDPQRITGSKRNQINVKFRLYAPDFRLRNPPKRYHYARLYKI